MIDPITITAGIATAKAVITGVKSALEMAKEAVDELRECAEAGKSAADSLGALGSFFSAASKIEEGVEAARHMQANPPIGEDGKPTKSDHEIVIEAMVAERQLRNFYTELREMFTYHFQESGLFDEYMKRLEALREDRRRAAMEARLKEKAVQMALRRKKQQMWQLMENTAAIIFGLLVSVAIVAGMVWMFQQGGRL